MPITVTLANEDQAELTHVGATKWTVERDTGCLVLMDEKSAAVAVYGLNKWMAARVNQDLDDVIYAALREGDHGLDNDQAINALTRLQNAGVIPATKE